jgi:hypothetical protein
MVPEIITYKSCKVLSVSCLFALTAAAPYVWMSLNFPLDNKTMQVPSALGLPETQSATKRLSVSPKYPVHVSTMVSIPSFLFILHTPWLVREFFKSKGFLLAFLHHVPVQHIHQTLRKCFE